MNDTIRADMPLLGTDDTVARPYRGGTGLVSPSWYTPGGRLSLTSGTPVTTGDLTAQTTLYYIPYVHDQIGLYTGRTWRLFQFGQISLLASTLSASTMYDIFVNGGNTYGSLGLIAQAWTNDTTRATSLSFQNGVQVNSGNNTQRWVGIVRTDANTKFCDAGAGATNSGRWLCNGYNKVQKHISQTDSSSHALTLATYVQVGSVYVDYVTDGTFGVTLEGQSLGVTSTGLPTLAIGSSTSAKEAGCISCVANIAGGIPISTTLNETLAAGRYQRFLIAKLNGALTGSVDGSQGDAPGTGLGGLVLV